MSWGTLARGMDCGLSEAGHAPCISVPSGQPWPWAALVWWPGLGLSRPCPSEKATGGPCACPAPPLLTRPFGLHGPPPFWQVAGSHAPCWPGATVTDKMFVDMVPYVMKTSYTLSFTVLEEAQAANAWMCKLLRVCARARVCASGSDPLCLPVPAPTPLPPPVSPLNPPPQKEPGTFSTKPRWHSSRAGCRVCVLTFPSPGLELSLHCCSLLQASGSVRLPLWPQDVACLCPVLQKGAYWR